MQAPSDLPPDLREAFAELVSSAGPRHFKPSDVPLIVQFLEANALAKRASKELREEPVIDGKPSAWLRVSEISNKTMIALAAKLRIGPSARMSQKQVSRLTPSSSALWDGDGDAA